MGVYSALAVAISAAEGMLPPLPFMPPGAKIGLSNIIVMFIACEASYPAALGIVIFKSIFALITRGATAALMTLAGGLLSATAVWLCSKSQRVGSVGLGIVGATAHNIGQFFVSMAIIGGAAAVYLPAMTLFGIVTGALTGLVLYLIIPTMKKIFYGGEKDGVKNR